MKKFQLTKLAMALVVIMFGFQAFAQGRIDLNGAKSAQQCTNVTKDGFSATFSFGSIEAAEVSTERGVFSAITMDGTYQSGNLGEPNLPAANKLFAVPVGAKNVTVSVKGYTTEVYNLADYGMHQIVPMQPKLRKDQKPEDIPFEYSAKAYAQKGFAERPIAQVEIEGTMRGIQIAALTVNPVQYDAANNTVRVYNNIDVEVSFGSYDKAAAEDYFISTFNPYFAGIYKTMFNERAINDIYDEHPDMWQNPVKMLVIANRAFESTIAEWVAWKTEKGFYVDVNYTDQIGSTAAAIRTFIQNKYEEDHPTFLMIMGDKNMVPESANGSATQCVTDLNYSSVDGDMFSDMYHSRFPAENASQLTAMLNKALEYEQLTMPDPSYLSNVLLIAGEDSGWGITVGRPAIWYATNYYYNTEHGFANVYEYTTSNYTGCYSHLNTGVGFANYTAHGSNTSWAGPSITVSDVNNLTNEHKYFLAMGNCCQAADWGISGTCFGEAMVRAENKAAYAYIGSCPSTYWLNDYYFAVGATSQANGSMPNIDITTLGCYDAIWDDAAYNVVDAIRFVGNLASNAAEALGYTIHISNLYDWQAYHTLGDGSILPYRVQPTDNTVSHMPTLPIGMDFYTVTAEPGSYVGISKDGVLYGAGMVDETGTTDIPMTPVTSGGNAKIVVTHPQHIPYIAEVPAAAMTGAYVAVDTYAMSAEQANYGETIDMAITLKNVGTLPSGAITATLTTQSEYVEVLAGSATAAALDPEATATIEGLQFSVAENVPDNTKAQFVLSVTDGTDVWDANITITLHAPVVVFESIAKTDSNVTFTFKNTGTAPFYGGTLNLTSCSPDLVFDPATIVVEDVVEGGETLVMTLDYTVDPSVEPGTTFEVAYDFTTGLFNVNDIFVLSYGAIMEDFESGSFGSDWTLSAQLPWQIIDGGRGSYCAKSNNNGQHNSSGYMQLSVNVLAAGELTFWYKVSSEQNYDKLHFYMDGQEKGVWSGTVAWTEFTQAVTTGQHTFKWEYTKDSSVSSGDDCAWVDDIKFPPVNVITFITPASNLEGVVENHDVLLTWDASADAVSYVVKRDGETIGETTETEYVDVLEETGTYRYSVYAVDANGSMSAPVSAIVTVDFTGVIENEDVKVSVYPNPSNGILNIVTNANNYEYQVINCVGQMVLSGNADGRTSLNVSELNGVYFLRIVADGEVIVRKVTVK
ncbi:MAG: T9SS type A sorting domain-containing protein [Bacteroidales bacterium]|nr:T9SS type A sorting domain-containing protein [Bacteroidales bacterium]